MLPLSPGRLSVFSKHQDTSKSQWPELFLVQEILRSGSDKPEEREAVLAKVAFFFSISQLPSSASTVRNARGELFTIV